MKWDKHQIIAEVHRRGSSLRKISRAAGLVHTACSCALSGRRWPRAEQALADFLDVPVSTLFPDRYPRADSDTSRRRHARHAPQPRRAHPTPCQHQQKRRAA